MRPDQMFVFVSSIVCIVSKNEALTITNHKLPDERQKSLLFPKSVNHFMITVATTVRSDTSSPTTSKRPLMPKTLPKIKVVEVKLSHKKLPVTRRPVMKLKKFVVDPVSLNREKEESSSNENYFKSHDATYSIEYEGHGSKNNNNNDNLIQDQSEEIFMKYVIGNESQSNEDNYTTEYKQELMENENNRPKRNKINNTKRMQEERKNHGIDEFNFTNKLVNPNDSEGTEATTEAYRTRGKRSVNIIEEENFGTTISGYKFTGRMTDLGSDLSFKNINS